MKLIICKHQIIITPKENNKNIILSDYEKELISNFIQQGYIEGEFEGENGSYSWYIDFNSILKEQKITIGELQNFLDYYETNNGYESDDYITFQNIKDFIS